MTPYVVVDTNVGVVANGRHENASTRCRLACVEALEEVLNSRIILVDDLNLIISEYGNHFSRSGQPGTGDAFFKWLHQNQGNTRHCRFVSITPTDSTCSNFTEFPTDQDLGRFDSNDRKFVAVALASGERRDVLNAVDSDWWNFDTELTRNGVDVLNLCPIMSEGRV